MDFRIIAGSAMLLLCCLLQTRISVADEASATPVIRAAMPRNFAPEYQVDNDQRPAGLAIELIESIARRADYEVEYQVYDTWLEAMDSLAAGAVDLIPQMGITAERREFALFTDPVYTFRVSVFVRSENTSVNSVRDMQGITVGAVGSNIGEFLLRTLPKHQPRLYTEAKTALLELVSGNIDALVYPAPAVWRLARDFEIDHLMRELDPPLKEVKRAVAVSQDRPDLHSDIQAVLPGLIQSQEYRDLIQRWFASPKPFWNSQRVVMLVAVVVAIMVSLVFLVRYWSLRTLYAKLLRETGQRQRIEDELKTLNHELEQRVTERTRDLEIAQRIGHMGSWVLDLKTDHLQWSDEIYHIFGIEPESFEASFEAFLGFVHADDRDKVIQAYKTSIRERQPYQVVHRIQRQDGSIRWVEERASTEFDDSGNPLVSHGTVQDITERVLFEQELESARRESEQALEKVSEMNLELQAEMAHNNLLENHLKQVTLYDPLTTLPNRHYLVNQAMELFSTDDSEPIELALIFIDISGIKTINENLGHATGDAALVEVSLRLSDAIREGDQLFRIGGDEFVVLAKVDADLELDAYMQQLISGTNQPYEMLAGKSLSISLGIALYPQHAHSLDDLIIKADQAMNEARQQGANRYQLFQA